MIREHGLRTRFKITVPLFTLLVGMVAGLIDGFLIVLQAPHLFPGLLEVLVFPVFSVGVYAVFGLAFGMGLSLLPTGLFVKIGKLDEKEMQGFSLSLLIGTTCALLLLVEGITFTTISENLVRNLLTILLILGGTYALIIIMTNIFRRFSGLLNLLTKSSAFLRNGRVLSGLAVVFVLSWFAVRPGGFSEVETSAAAKPNIILISFDTLSAKHVGCYGYSKPTTPNIDRFAEEGALFENQFSVSRITLPSHMSMLTSVYPAVHQAINSFASVLDDRFVTLAEILKENGYETGAMVDGNRLMNIGAAHGFDQGFDFYDHYPERFFRHEKLYVLKRLANFTGNFLHRHGIPDMHSDTIFSGALSWLTGRKQDRPFFLFLHTYDIHSDWGTQLPYVAPRKYEELIPSDYSGDFTGCGSDGVCATKHLVNINKKVRRGGDPEKFLSQEAAEYIATLYDRGIRYTDDQFGLFFDDLRRSNLLDDTIILLTSDHGEEFYEHAQLKHVQYYDEVLEVPLLIRYPGKIDPGTRVESLSRAVDLLPTLLDLAGIASNSEQFQGVSLVPYLTPTNGGLKDLTLFAGQDHPSMDAETKIARTLNYKYIRNGSDRKHYKFNLERSEELYDVRNDPGETQNLIGQIPAIHHSLQDKMETWSMACLKLRDEIMPTELTQKIEIDRKAAEALKSLGYVK